MFTEVPSYDAVILGGGLAGLTLSIQLMKARPGTRILVTERIAHPAPEAAFKVGESTVEIGAHYMTKVIGMREHIEKQQLPKLGLRFFFPADDNRKIEARAEFGPYSFPEEDILSYQLDRGRFENALREEAIKLGVTFIDQSQAKTISFGDPQHTVTLRRGEEEMTVAARWVVDATGRASFLKRKLQLEQEVGHKANAAWFRVAKELDIHQWSDDEAWRGRVPSGERRLSTNHLMGTGYWVWLIPLGSGSTSVGIVADAQLHPFDTINQFEKALQWLHKHEPQCAAAVEAHRDHLQDFRVLKHFSHGCKQVFSHERWCLTGEAGVFLDPFYSPGSDFIAMSNSLVNSLIVNELAGEDIRERVEIYQKVYMELFETSLTIYEGQYPLMGNAQVMLAKIAWDGAIYGAINAFLYFHNKVTDKDFMPTIYDELARCKALQRRVQGFFHEWAALEKREWHNFYAAIQDMEYMDPLVQSLVLTPPPSDETLRQMFQNNLHALEDIAVHLFRKAAAQLPEYPAHRRVNPYAITLNPQRWETEGTFLDDAPPEREVIGLHRIWLDQLATLKPGAEMLTPPLMAPQSA